MKSPGGPTGDISPLTVATGPIGPAVASITCIVPKFVKSLLAEPPSLRLGQRPLPTTNTAGKLQSPPRPTNVEAPVSVAAAAPAASAATHALTSDAARTITRNLRKATVPPPLRRSLATAANSDLAALRPASGGLCLALLD